MGKKSGKKIKNPGDWDGKLGSVAESIKTEGLGYKVPNWIHAGRDLKLLYEDLMLVKKRIDRKDADIDVSVRNHNYPEGKIPMLYLIFSKDMDKNLIGKLEEKLVGDELGKEHGLIKYKMFKKDTPFASRKGVVVSCFSYNAEDYGVVGNGGIEED